MERRERGSTRRRGRRETERQGGREEGASGSCTVERGENGDMAVRNPWICRV